MLPVAPMTRILISMLLICGVHRRPAAPPTLGRGRRRMSTASGLWSAPERGRAGRDDLAVGKQIVHPASRAAQPRPRVQADQRVDGDRKSTRLNSSHVAISYAVFCLKKKN